MAFEWDDNKRQINAEKHGIDFEEAAEIFDGRTTITLESDFPTEPRLSARSTGCS